MTEREQDEVERVARAIYCARYWPGWWGGTTEPMRGMYLEMARAAIQEMRDNGEAALNRAIKEERERCAKIAEDMIYGENTDIARAIRAANGQPDNVRVTCP